MSSCNSTEEGEKCAEEFFSKLISKDYQGAANLIDPKSDLYPNRFRLVNQIANDSVLGKLNSTGGDIIAYNVTSVRSFRFSSVDLPVILNYDSTSIMVRVQVIDRGKGFLINEIRYEHD